MRGVSNIWEWGSEDMTDTDDSEWEDLDEREKRLYVERNNFDLFEGMTPLTYTPPQRKNRRRRYEVMVKNGPEIQESTGHTSELEFQTDEESPNSEPIIQPGTVVDEVILTSRDKKDNRGCRRRAGSDADTPSDESLNLSDRPVTELVTAWAGSDSHIPSNEHSKKFGRPVTEVMTAWAGSDTDFISDEHSELVNRPVTESVTKRDGGNTDVPGNELSEFADRLVTESVSPRAGMDTDVISDEHSELVNRPVTELVTERDRSDTDFEHSEFVDRPITESVSIRVLIVL